MHIYEDLVTRLPAVIRAVAGARSMSPRERNSIRDEAQFVICPQDGSSAVAGRLADAAARFADACVAVNEAALALADTMADLENAISNNGAQAQRNERGNQ